MEKPLARAARFFLRQLILSVKKMSEEKSQPETADSSPTPPLSAQNALKSFSFTAVSDYKRTGNRRDKSWPIPLSSTSVGCLLRPLLFLVLSVHSVRYRSEITCNQLQHFLMGQHGRATFYCEDQSFLCQFSSLFP